MSPPALTHTDVEDAYENWAPVYDAVFAWVLGPGRRAAAAATNRCGGRVLDVGIGTGLELPMFSPALRITGVDLSEPMLRIARRRATARRLANVDDLMVMDAMNLTFGDASFDVVVAPYVLTVVPDPARTLDEMARVTKPGGEIVIVNHIARTGGPIAAIETWLGQHSARLGWHPQFPWHTIGDWIARRPDIDLIERRTLAPLGLFTLTRLARR